MTTEKDIEGGRDEVPHHKDTEDTCDSGKLSWFMICAQTNKYNVHCTL